MKLYIFGKKFAAECKWKKINLGEKCKSPPNCFAFTQDIGCAKWIEWHFVESSSHFVHWNMETGKFRDTNRKSSIICQFHDSGCAMQPSQSPRKKVFGAQKYFQSKSNIYFCFVFHLIYFFLYSSATQCEHFILFLVYFVIVIKNDTAKNIRQ